MDSQLIVCKLCTGLVSSNATCCPHCGDPIYKPNAETTKSRINDVIARIRL